MPSRVWETMSLSMDDASVRRAVVQIDTLLEGDGVVFVLAGRGGWINSAWLACCRAARVLR